MKFLYTFLLTIVVSSIAQAQYIKLDPKWKTGQTETLELIKSKLDIEADTVSSRDSIHAIIKSEVISQDLFKVRYSWTFQSYYQDTTGLHDKDKITARIVGAFVHRCPIKFSIRKDDYSVKIDNDKQIDSAENSVSEEIKALAKRKGENKNDDGMMDIMITFLVSTDIEKHLLSLPKLYYAAYQEDSFIVGKEVKKDDKNDESKQSWMKDVKAESTSIWEELPKGIYRYKQHSTGSIVGLGEMFAKLAMSMDSTLADKKVPMSKVDDIMRLTSETEYSLDKYNANVIGYYQSSITSGAMMGTRSNNKEWSRLRKVD